MESDINDLLIGTAEIAEMFHVGLGGPRSWRRRKTGPPWKYVRGECKYRIGDIKAWIMQFDTKRGRYLLQDVENWLEKRAANVA